MKLSSFLDELKQSDSYKSFIDENSDAFFSMGLFILDLKSNEHNLQFDFFLPSKDRLASFQYPSFKLKVHDDPIKDLVRQKTDLKVDISDLESSVKGVIASHNVSFSSSKIIATLKGSQYNITCMDDMLGILRIKIDALSGEELSFSKGSLFEVAQVKGGALGQKYDEARKASSQSS